MELWRDCHKNPATMARRLNAELNPRSPTEVARRLKAFRQARGLNKAEFARACGIVESQVTNYEGTHARGGVSQLVRDAVVKTFGVDDNFINDGNLWCLTRDQAFLVAYQDRLKHPKEPPRQARKRAPGMAE